MELRREIKITPFSRKMSLDDRVLLIGSCFSENIGRKLSLNKFRVSVNPFGTLYNPHSIFKVLENCLGKNPVIPEDDIIFNQGIYRNFNFHSVVSHQDKTGLVRISEEKLRETGSFIDGAGWMIITFGTAIVYRYNETGKIVANCHKIPSGRFSRSMLSVEEIETEFRDLHSRLMAVNGKLNILLTVSPVRHLREGFEDNQVSKSILRLACEKIVTSFDNVQYFPSYEIMIDDLRDYRFYGEDLVHPNDLGINYIWEKFREALMDEDTLKFIREWTTILNAINHKPFHPETSEYRDFVSNTIRKLELLKGKIDVEEEINKLRQSL